MARSRRPVVEKTIPSTMWAGSPVFSQCVKFISAIQAARTTMAWLQKWSLTLEPVRPKVVSRSSLLNNFVAVGWINGSRD